MSDYMRTCRLLSLMMLLTSVGAFAALPMARLNTVFPMGAQRGQSVEVVLDGADLEGTTSLYFSRSGVTAEHLGELRFKVTVAADVPVGPIDVRAIGDWGVSNPRTFTVGTLVEGNEAESNNFPDQAQKIAVDNVMNGVVGGRADVDYYLVSLAQGETVVIDCEGERIDSLLDGVLTIFGPDGRALDLSDRYYGKDARLDFTAPMKGDYRVRVHDLVYNGGNAYFYRLSVHRQPVVDYVFPPVATAGQESQVQIVGRNLPNSTKNESLVVRNRPMEELSAKVAAPASDAIEAERFLAPRGARLDAFAFRFEPSPPVLVGTTSLAVALEAEPNDTDAQAQVVAWPTEVAGRLDHKEDRDLYRFAGKAGQAIEIEGISETAGFAADLIFLVRQITATSADGKIETKEIGEFDDIPESVGGQSYITSTHDPIAAFTPPADGDYLLEVRDRFAESRGDGRFVYRLRMAPPTPDYRLMVAPADPSNPSSILVRKGGTTEATVYALRKGGFAGEIHVSVKGLPTGVSASPVILGPNVNQAAVVFYSDANAADFTGPIEIVGTAKIGDVEVPHSARPATILWPAGGNAPRPARLTRSLCLAVRGTAPYLLSAQPADVKIGQGAQLIVPIKLQRLWADYTDKLAGVTAAFLPGGVDNDATEIAPGQNEARLNLYFKPDVAPGTYTFIVKGAGNVPFTKNTSDPKAQKAPVEVADPSQPIQITVVPRPLEIALESAAASVKPGQSANLKVSVRRHNGYAGPARLRLTLPPGLGGLVAPELTVPADVTETLMPIQIAGDMALGEHGDLAVRGTAQIGEELIPVDARLTLNVAN